MINTNYPNALSNDVCRNIYDIMAVCYSHLVPYHAHKGNDCPLQQYQAVYDIISAFTEEYGLASVNNIKSLINSLNNIIDNKTCHFDDCFCYNMILAIDNAFKFTYPSALPKFEASINIHALNTNYDSTNIFIFPRMENGIIQKIEQESIKHDPQRKGFRSRKIKEPNDSINRNLSNYIICCGIEDYSPDLTILPAEKTLVDRIHKRHEIRIGIAPLTKYDIFSLFEIDDYTKKDTFSILSPKVEKEEELLRIFGDQLKSFSDKDVDIIVFPEMYLTDSIIENIETIIADSLGFADNNFKLIIAGTLWKNKCNKCFVYDNYGNLLYTQNKFEPFEYKGKLEDLKADDYLVHILDINGLGRISTLICRDIYNKSLHNMIATFKGDIILYPAYSPSLDVESEAVSHTNFSGCISVFSNACASRITSKDEDIGFCTVPQRYKTNTSTYICRYGCNSKRNCSGICKPIVLSILYENFEYDGDRLNCQVLIS